MGKRTLSIQLLGLRCDALDASSFGWGWTVRDEMDLEGWGTAIVLYATLSIFVAFTIQETQLNSNSVKIDQKKVETVAPFGWVRPWIL